MIPLYPAATCPYFQTPLVSFTFRLESKELSNLVTNPFLSLLNIFYCPEDWSFSPDPVVGGADHNRSHNFFINLLFIFLSSVLVIFVFRTFYKKSQTPLKEYICSLSGKLFRVTNRIRRTNTRAFLR